VKCRYLPKLFQKCMVFVLVAVLVDEALDSLKVNQLLVLLPSEQVGVLADELLDEVLGAFSLTFSPLVQDWLEKTLVEFGHGPECGSSVEKVELFIILFALILVKECLFANLGVSVGGSVGIVFHLLLDVFVDLLLSQLDNY
jgi:hypothetical protein